MGKFFTLKLKHHEQQYYFKKIKICYLTWSATRSFLFISGETQQVSREKRKYRYQFEFDIYINIIF